MVGLTEAAAIAIVGGTLADVAVSLNGSLRRRAQDAKQRDAELRAYRESADLLLVSARAEQQRIELSWNGLRKFRIDKKIEESKDICSFYLTPHDGHPIPPFLPGQHLTFQLRVPGQPDPVIRCYSLSDSPNHTDRYRVTIKRIPPPASTPDAPPGLSSSYFHDHLREGDTLDVRAPGGIFHLDITSPRPVVLVGGGVGITPMLSMLNAITESGSRAETWLFYGVVNRLDHIMHDHLSQLVREHDNVKLHVVYSRPTESCVQGRDYDHQGYISRELLESLLPSNNYEFYICGPPPMMEALTRDLDDWGVPESDIKFEAFGPSTVKRVPGPSRDVPADGIEVEFARSGKSCRWNVDSGNLLELAEASGVFIPFGCRGGSCGTCATAIKQGEIESLITPQADPGDGSCLACISVPKKRLVLDA